MKKLLLLQARPEDPASDGEFNSVVKLGKIKSDEIHRVRMELAGIPEIDLNDYWGVFVGGTPFNVSDFEDTKSDAQKLAERDLYKLIDQIIEKDFPFLGGCYAIGAMAERIEPGIVSKEKYSEPVGPTTIKLIYPAASDDPITSGLPKEFRAFVGHKEAVQRVPKGAVHLGRSDKCLIQMYRYKQNIYATQFHPELDGEALELRINVYKHAGYFPPEDAEDLINVVHQESVTVPEKILRRFVNRYRS